MNNLMEMTLHFTFIYIDKKINQFLNVRRTTYKSFAYHSLGNAALQNSLQGKSFNDLEDVKKYLKNFFFLKPAKFYADGIFRLPDSWTKIINNNRSYFTKKSLLKRFLSLYSKSKKNAKNFLDNLIGNKNAKGYIKWH